MLCYADVAHKSSNLAKLPVQGVVVYRCCQLNDQQINAACMQFCMPSGRNLSCSCMQQIGCEHTGKWDFWTDAPYRRFECTLRTLWCASRPPVVPRLQCAVFVDQVLEKVIEKVDEIAEGASRVGVRGIRHEVSKVVRRALSASQPGAEDFGYELAFSRACHAQTRGKVLLNEESSS